MAADSGSDTNGHEDAEHEDPELANGDSVSERLDKIDFEEDDGNSVAEIREELSLDS